MISLYLGIFLPYEANSNLTSFELASNKLPII
jgi:hypothetical protein